MNCAIEASGVQFGYNKKIILTDVCIHVPAGSIFGFLGLNGAGKSTFIKVLLGLLTTQRGDIKIFGIDIRKEKLKALAKIGAFVEGPALYPDITVYDYLRVKQVLLGLKSLEIDKVLDDLDLKEFKDVRSKNLSFGMKQRLGIAFSLLGDPDLLILDEPANGLDPDGIRDMRNLILRLNRDLNKTIFMSSHILDEVEKTCTDIAIISKGRIIISDQLDKIISRNRNVLQLKVDNHLAAAEVLQKSGYECIGSSKDFLQVYFQASMIYP